MKFFISSLCVLVLLFGLILADDKIELPDYTNWKKTEMTFLWQPKDSETKDVLDVVFYSNTSQDGKYHSIILFNHPNQDETMQLAWYTIEDHENNTSNDYFFEKKETDENWLFVKDINNLGWKKLNQFLDKRYNFQF